MFDIGVIREASSADLELLHPLTRQKLGATITIAGPEHPQRKKILHERQRRLRAKFAKSQKLTFADPAEEDEDEIELLAACTLGWRGLNSEGAELQFSQQEARKLYSNPELAWLRAQVRAGLDDLELFIKPSASDS
jgi:hypothetical protein